MGELGGVGQPAGPEVEIEDDDDEVHEIIYS
jgi:hypothetical protein